MIKPLAYAKISMLIVINMYVFEKNSASYKIAQGTHNGIKI